MRNFLERLGKALGVNVGHPALGPMETPSHAMLLEAQAGAAFDIDAIWYYERLKWQTRD